MMRGLLVLSGLVFLARAEVDGVACSINAERAVDEMLDSAVYIWASLERCGKPGHVVKCEMDLSRAAESVTAMVNVLVHAMHDCGGIQGDVCGMAAGKLVQSAGGLSASAGGIYDKCIEKKPSGSGPTMIPSPFGKWAFCIVDVKDSLRSLMDAIQRMIHSRRECKEADKQCGASVASILSAFAALGQYATAATGHCAPTGKSMAADKITPAQHETIECSEQISMAVRHASQLAVDAGLLSEECDKSASRLYELESDKAKSEKDEKSDAFTTPLLLALPFAAVLGFSLGSRFGRRPAGQDRDLALDGGEFAPLHLLESEEATGACAAD